MGAAHRACGTWAALLSCGHRRPYADRDMKIKTSALTLLGLLGATPLLAERLLDASNAPEALWIAFWGIGLISFSRALRARVQSSSGDVTEQTRPVVASTLVTDVRPRVAEPTSVSTRTPRSQSTATPKAAVLRDRLWVYARQHHGQRGPGDSALTGGQAST